jgi:imidazolonepropionase-like amidohydrolase
MRNLKSWMAGALLGLLVIAIAATSLSAQQKRIVIAASTVLDGHGNVLHNTRVVVEGSKIVAIDPKAGPVDYDFRGLTLLPGLIDTHVHLTWHFDENHKSVNGGEKPEITALYTAEDAWVTLEGGVTTVQSVGAAMDGPVRDRIALGVLPGARVLTSLRQITNQSGDPDALRALVRQTKPKART